MLNYRRATAIIILLLTNFIRADSRNEFWQCAPNDYICQGAWQLPEKQAKALTDPELTINFEKTKLNLQTQSLNGENLVGRGDGFYLKANKVSFSQKQQRHLILEGNCELSTKIITLLGDKFLFEEAGRQGMGEQVSFIIYPWQIHGTAKAIKINGQSFNLENVRYSQCPPDQESWHLTTKTILWDDESKRLMIQQPLLRLYDYPLFYLPSVDITEDRGTKQVVALPHIKFLSKRGLALKFPYLLNHQESSITITPEISTKFGPSATLEYSKDNQNITIFSKILSWGNPWDYYFGWDDSHSFANGVELDFSLNYVGNKTAVYRYSEIIPSYKKQFLPNFISLRKTLDSGFVQLYSEKIQIFEEKEIRDDNLIETPLRLSHFFQKPHFNLWQFFSIIHQKKGPEITRYQLAAQWLPRFPAKFKGHFIVDDVERTLANFVINTSTWIPYLGNPHLAFSGHASEYLEGKPITPIESRYLPMTFSSLLNDKWHNGNDWAARYAFIRAHLRYDIFENMTFESAGLFSLGKTKILSRENLYSSPFRQSSDRISALGFKLEYINNLSIQSLFSKDLNQLISLEIEKHFQQKDYQAYATIFLHNYFPEQAEQSTYRVKQLQWGIQTTARKANEFFFHGNVDLRPFKLNKLQIGVEQYKCCYSQVLGFHLQKEYSYRTQKRELEYGIAYKLELQGLGFMRLGSSRHLSLKRINKRAMPMTPKFKAYD